MDKRDKLEKAKAALQQEIDKLDAKEQKVCSETEMLLDSESETLEGGDKNEGDDICGFFCVSDTF